MSGCCSYGLRFEDYGLADGFLAVFTRPSFNRYLQQAPQRIRYLSLPIHMPSIPISAGGSIPKALRSTLTAPRELLKDTATAESPAKGGHVPALPLNPINRIEQQRHAQPRITTKSAGGSE